MTEQNNEVAPPTYSPDAEVEEDELTNNHIYLKVCYTKLKSNSDMNMHWYEPQNYKRIFKVVPNDTNLGNDYPRDTWSNKLTLERIFETEKICEIKLRDMKNIQNLFIENNEPHLIATELVEDALDGKVGDCCIDCDEDIYFIYYLQKISRPINE